LKARGKPYWQTIGKGLHLGYRKGKTTSTWVVRRYIGEQQYEVEAFASADDKEDANGVEILDYWQAQDHARGLRQRSSRSADGFTVKDAINLYLEYLDGKPSARDTKNRLYAYAMPVFGDRPVASIEVDEFRSWHRNISKQGARTRTRPGSPQNYRKTGGDPEAARKRQVSANRCRSLLFTALNLAWSTDKIRCERVWMKVKPFRGVDIPRQQYLEVAEAQRLLNACDPDFRILVRASLETGARFQELARLRVSDFNRNSGTLHVRQSKSHKDRHIVLTEEGQEFFSNLAAGRARSDLLLGRAWKPNDQSTPWKHALNRARLPHMPFHCLRHTWASLSVMAGVPLMVVAKNLGHRDTRMVEAHYGHISPSYVADEIRRGAPRYGVIEPSNVAPMGGAG
jgi:integrase